MLSLLGKTAAIIDRSSSESVSSPEIRLDRFGFSGRSAGFASVSVGSGAARLLELMNVRSGQSNGKWIERNYGMIPKCLETSGMKRSVNS